LNGFTSLIHVELRFAYLTLLNLPQHGLPFVTRFTGCGGAEMEMQSILHCCPSLKELNLFPFNPNELSSSTTFEMFT